MPTFHFIVNCVAGFSFLTSAMFMSLVHVPHDPMWRHLRNCKHYLSLVFLVVGLSCSKTVFFNLAPDADIIITSTLISAGIQSLLFACMSITFVNPNWVRKKWVYGNTLLILCYSSFLLMCLLWWQHMFWFSATMAGIIYFGLLISYQVIFYREYNRCIRHTDTITDEYSESRFAWIKHFFMAVSLLGLTAGIAPFMPIIIYDIWMLCAAAFYVYVVLSFVNYWGSTAQLVYNVYKADKVETSSVPSAPVIPDSKQALQHFQAEQLSTAEPTDFDKLDVALQAWIAERGFAKNDLVSDEFAQSLGVSIATLRAYFNQKYQMDFRQWRTKLRIDYACSIIREHPDYSYDTIAEMVGICDRSNFTRIFKKITGMTPKGYANKA